MIKRRVKFNTRSKNTATPRTTDNLCRSMLSLAEISSLYAMVTNIEHIHSNDYLNYDNFLEFLFYSVHKQCYIHNWCQKGKMKRVRVQMVMVMVTVKVGHN